MNAPPFCFQRLQGSQCVGWLHHSFRNRSEFRLSGLQTQHIGGVVKGSYGPLLLKILVLRPIRRGSVLIERPQSGVAYNAYQLGSGFATNELRDTHNQLGFELSLVSSRFGWSNLIVGA